jgi:hypothetical protein
VWALHEVVHDVAARNAVVRGPVVNPQEEPDVSVIALTPMLDLLERNLTLDTLGAWKECDCIKCKARREAVVFLDAHRGLLS